MFSRLELEAIAGLILAAAVCLGLWRYNVHEQALGAAQFQAQATAQALAGEKAARAKSDQRAVAIQQKADYADQAASAARADADAARTAGDRLRYRLAAAEHSRSAVNPAAPAASSPADSPALVPWIVFEGVRDAAGQFASYADQLRVSLDACIGSYRALTP